MSRPRKWRRVCELPERNLYGPLHGSRTEGETLSMTVEEYETLRLIDLESLTQEECAERMPPQPVWAGAFRRLLKKCLTFIK